MKWFATICLAFILRLCDSLPFRDMTKNIIDNGTEGGNAAELFAVHQDLHAVLSPLPEDLPVDKNGSILIPPPIATDVEMEKALQKASPVPVQIDLGQNSTSRNITAHASASNESHATPSDRSSVLVKFGDSSKKSGVGLATRDLLPSIVGGGNKELSSNPVEGSGVPPSAIAQAKGQLPKDSMPNPFGSQPANIPIAESAF